MFTAPWLKTRKSGISLTFAYKLGTLICRTTHKVQNKFVSCAASLRVRNVHATLAVSLSNTSLVAVYFSPLYNKAIRVLRTKTIFRF